MMTLHTLDDVAIAADFLCTDAIGAWAMRAHSNADELFLAGRSLGPATMAIPLLPHLQHSDQVWPELVVRDAPVGLAGFIIAGLLAALMSTCSATRNSAATLLTLDFVAPCRPQLSQRRLTMLGRAFILGIALLWVFH